MKITAASDFGNLTDLDNVKRFLSGFAGQVKDAVNGGIDTGNLKAVVRSVTFNAANQDTQVGHGLGVIPTGYIKIAGDNISVFDGSADNTVDNIYVQASGAGTVSLLVMV